MIPLEPLTHGIYEKEEKDVPPAYCFSMSVFFSLHMLHIPHFFPAKELIPSLFFFFFAHLDNNPKADRDLSYVHCIRSLDL